MRRSLEAGGSSRACKRIITIDAPGFAAPCHTPRRHTVAEVNRAVEVGIMGLVGAAWRRLWQISGKSPMIHGVPRRQRGADRQIRSLAPTAHPPRLVCVRRSEE